MKEVHEYEKDLASIRDVMERSAKFISLSGLSGVLAGIYALIGAGAAYFVAQYPVSPLDYRQYSIREPDTFFKLLIIAALVLTASLTTGILLSKRKAKKHGLKFWTSVQSAFVFQSCYSTGFWWHFYFDHVIYRTFWTGSAGLPNFLRTGTYSSELKYF